MERKDFNVDHDVDTRIVNEKFYKDDGYLACDGWFRESSSQQKYLRLLLTRQRHHYYYYHFCGNNALVVNPQEPPPCGTRRCFKR